jgi:uncharacterized membrane protein YqgA involved in biofilm formation
VGTLINVLAILAGSAIGVLLGNRLPEKMSRTLTDAMGLIVLVIGALNLADLSDEAFANATGVFPTILVVLASLLLGGVTGSLSLTMFRGRGKRFMLSLPLPEVPGRRCGRSTAW